MLYRTSIAPGADHSLPVLLPIVSAQESFDVSLRAENSLDGPLLKRHRASVALSDLAALARANELLLVPTKYADRSEDLPQWPSWLLRDLLLIGTFLLLAMGWTLLVRPPGLRLALLAAVVVFGSLGMVRALTGCNPIERGAQGPFVSLTCRRTARWSDQAGDLTPAYRNREHMNADDALLAPGEQMTVTLHPNRPRLFRRTGPGPAETRP